jgi:hypothetical protein
MYLTKTEREELSQLSKEVFGARGRWQKLLNSGGLELVTRKITEEVPSETGESTTKETSVAVLAENGTKRFTTKYYTVESIKEYMLSLKAQRDELIAMINTQNEELKKKAEQEKLLKDINEQSGGSAL